MIALCRSEDICDKEVCSAVHAHLVGHLVRIPDSRVTGQLDLEYIMCPTDPYVCKGVCT